MNTACFLSCVPPGCPPLRFLCGKQAVIPGDLAPFRWWMCGIHALAISPVIYVSRPAWKFSFTSRQRPISYDGRLISQLMHKYLFLPHLVVFSKAQSLSIMFQTEDISPKFGIFNPPHLLPFELIEPVKPEIVCSHRMYVSCVPVETTRRLRGLGFNLPCRRSLCPRTLTSRRPLYGNFANYRPESLSLTKNEEGQTVCLPMFSL